MPRNRDQDAVLVPSLQIEHWMLKLRVAGSDLDLTHSGLLGEQGGVRITPLCDQGCPDQGASRPQFDAVDAEAMAPGGTVRPDQARWE